jgi:hypothetical protein
MGLSKKNEAGWDGTGRLFGRPAELCFWIIRCMFVFVIEMARLLFDIFYDEECVSEDAFFEWLKHPDQSETECKII